MAEIGFCAVRCSCKHGLLQGKRHQQNLAKRAAREAAEKPALPQPNRRATTKKTVKIGRPGYKVTKQYDPDTMQRSLLFQVMLVTNTSTAVIHGRATR